jgi:anti-sigma-K factor RskA
VNLYECPRIDDAAGYVLGAMTDSEAESYRHHVTECGECEGKVAELHFVSHALLSAVPQLSAPPEIRDRVMAVVRAEAELLAAAGAGADRPPRAEPRRFGWGFARLRPLTAGALAAVLIALGIGAGTLLRSGSSCTTTAASLKPAAGAGATGKLTTCDDAGARIAFDNLAPLPEGRSYQLWYDYADDGKLPKPGDLIAPRNGHASVDASDLKPGMDLLVTVEPAGGSETPTTEPIIQASA